MNTLVTRRLAYSLRRARAALAHARLAEPLEFKQLIIRLVIGVFTTACAIISARTGALDAGQITILTIFIPSAWLVAVSFIVHFAFWSGQTTIRRSATIGYDAITLSLFIYFAGEPASLFFPVYLWVILGNGFRFGIAAMYGSMAANIVCFAFTAWATPHWHENWQFSIGLILALIIIPVYVSKLIRELRHAMAKVETADRAKSDFLSAMSHELRTPLNAIMGLSQVLDRTASSPDDRSLAVSIHRAASRLLSMVDMILNFQKVQNRAVEIEEKPFDVTALLHATTAILRPIAQSKGIRLHVRFASAIDPLIASDADHVETILMNLIGNAVKYTSEGHVQVSLSQTFESEHDATLRISVRDTGMGIDPRDHAAIFGRFTQTRATERGPEGGVGLGLSMCQSLVDLLGGQIGFTSALNEGSEFWFEVPVRRCAPDQPPAATACENIAFLTSRADFQRLSGNSGPGAPVCGNFIAQPGEFIHALAPGELWRYLLIIDPDGLNEADSTAILTAAGRAPIPPAIALVGRSARKTAQLCDIASAVLEDPGSPEARGVLHTLGHWHGMSLAQLSEHAPPAPAVRSLRVLVADDNAFNREVARRLLGLDGHQTVMAETGEAAFDALLRGGLDCAFIDINMPGGDGIEICQQYFAALPADARIPVYAITADVSERTKLRCLNAGMTAVLHKPIKLDELRELVTRHAEAAPFRTSVAGRSLASGARTHDGVSPALDPERIRELNLLFGAEAFRSSLLDVFRRDILSTMRNLRRAIRNGQSAQISSMTHALKSSAGNMGAVQLSAIAGTKQAEAGRIGRKEFAELMRAYRRFVREVRVLLENMDDADARGGLVDDPYAAFALGDGACAPNTPRALN